VILALWTRPRSDGHAQHATAAAALSLTLHLRAGCWVGANYGPTFRRLWTKVHQITSADTGEIVVCNAVFRLSISCSVPEIFAIEVRSRPKSRRKSTFFGPQFLGGRPQFMGVVFRIAPISVSRSCGKVSRRSAERPRRSRAE